MSTPIQPFPSPDPDAPPRSAYQLLMFASSRAVGFTKADLHPNEMDWLRGLATFLLETDEFIFTRNPLAEPVQMPVPLAPLPPEPSDGDG